MWESLISVTLCVFAGHSGDFGEELSVELLLLLHIERRVEMLQGTSEVGMSYLEASWSRPRTCRRDHTPWLVWGCCSREGGLRVCA